MKVNNLNTFLHFGLPSGDFVFVESGNLKRKKKFLSGSSVRRKPEKTSFLII
jgi:hypothetical protein